MAEYTGVNHLAMVTHNMNETIRFWRDFLGMRLVAGVGDGRHRHYFFEISEYDMIAFFEWPDVKNVPKKDHGVPTRDPIAFDHVSIGVESDDDLWELIDKFNAADMWVSEVIDHGFIHSIYAFDPNNIPIEFSAPVPGVDVRERPKMRDREPTAFAKEGTEQQPDIWPKVEKATPVAERAVYPGAGRIIADDASSGDGKGI